MSAPYPWQAAFWQSWQRLRQQPAQAYLLCGESGWGVDGLAQAMARSLLCPQGGCGQCDSCRQVAAGTHGDLHSLAPEAGRREITVDQVRALIQRVMETTHAAEGRRIIWLHPAEALNASAANALLKTLEEPPPRTTFILQAAQPGRLLATIRSRCQLLNAPRPDEASALGWLEAALPQFEQDQLRRALALHFGAPLDAAAWLEQGGWTRYETWRAQMNDLSRGRRDVAQVAAEWAQLEDVAEPLRFLLGWTAQKMAQQPTPRWHRLYQRIVETLRALSGNANVALALEAVLIEFVYGEHHAHHR